MIEITKQFVADEGSVLDYLRNRAAESLQEVCATYAATEFKKRGAAMNKAMIGSCRSLIQATVQKADAEQWTKGETLGAILMLTYADYVAMLEARNAIWPYEYMAFSRRVGELWERFCKRCFDFPIKSLEYYIPPLFAEVQGQLKSEIAEYVDQLTITKEQKKELIGYYQKVWSLVTSGEIKLELDLHFRLGKEKFNIDFKSGFGSNEKGNTNRLLLVATVYKNLEDNHHCVLLVRSREDQNNHYFQTLKKSSVWQAHCGGDAYEKIREFTGFDLHAWITDNIDWDGDVDSATMEHFRKNNLDGYLTWH